MQGINFKEQMFLATIEGWKTKTRRIMKPQPDGRFDGKNVFGVYVDSFHDKAIKPRYKVGEVVYLKEPYRLESRGAGVYEVHYQFGGEPKLVDTTARGIRADKIIKIIRSQERLKSGYANKLFMPEWAARYFIRITDVRDERLQEISDEDCTREGIMDCSIPGLWPNGADYKLYCYEKNAETFNTPQRAYAALIDKIHGHGAWDSNPYVWVYDYELCEKPIKF